MTPRLLGKLLTVTATTPGRSAFKWTASTGIWSTTGHVERRVARLSKSGEAKRSSSEILNVNRSESSTASKAPREPLLLKRKLRRSTGKTHTVQDGWYNLEISRSYPKPSPLPDLRLETEPIAWDDTWAIVEAKVHKALRCGMSENSFCNYGLPFGAAYPPVIGTDLV